MNKLCLLSIFILFTLILTSCSNYSTCTAVVLNNNWPCAIETSPRRWVRDADHWFLTGEPISLKDQCKNENEKTIPVRVDHFNQVYINGTYTIQMTGGQPHNSILLKGPRDALRLISVTVYDDVLYINQPKGPNVDQLMSQVTLRICVDKLHSLIKRGNGNVYGRYIQSNDLSIDMAGQGDMMLAGSMNIKTITKNGPDTLTVIGISAPTLDIIATGGTVNIAGNIGIHSITNRGSLINIIGANSDPLCIFASQCSTTKIIGCVNLQRLIANQYSTVLVNGVKSPCLSIYQSGHACVGLAGMVSNLDICLKGCSHFVGKYLHSYDAYVRTYNSSHADVYTENKLFSITGGNSSLYYFGPTKFTSPFISGHGNIVHL